MKIYFAMDRNPRTGKMGMTYKMHEIKGGVYDESFDEVAKAEGWTDEEKKKFQT